MSKFHLRIRELRTSRKLSQQELADQLGISKSSVNMYERGEREPGLDTLEAIADFFNVDMDYLTGKTDNPQKYVITGEESDILTDNEHKLIDIYRNLNQEGQEKLLDTASDMSELSRYKKHDESAMVQKEA